MFKFFLIILCFVLVFVSIFFIGLVVGGGEVIEARSGCCSVHGGVCGCGCCDSSRLSTICEQYYMECEDVGFEFVENKKDNGWILALTYAVGVSLFLFFAKIRYKIKKSKN